MLTLCLVKAETSLSGTTLISSDIDINVAPQDRARNISTMLGSKVRGDALKITSDDETLKMSLKEQTFKAFSYFKENQIKICKVQCRNEQSMGTLR